MSLQKLGQSKKVTDNEDGESMQCSIQGDFDPKGFVENGFEQNRSPYLS